MVALRPATTDLARHQDLNDLEARVKVLENLVMMQTQATLPKQEAIPVLKQAERERIQKEQLPDTGTNDERCKMIIADGFSEKISLCQPQDETGQNPSIEMTLYESMT